MKERSLTSNAHLTVEQSIYRPQIGIALWKVGDRGLTGFETAGAAGLDHVHVDLGGPNRGPDLTDIGVLAAFDTTSRRFALPITALAVNRLNDLGLTAPKGSEEALEVRRIILHAIRVADRLRVPRIIIPGFRQSLVRTPEDVAKTAEVLRFALGPAQAVGITLAYESGLDSERTLQILQAVGQPGVCVQFDTGNPAIYGHSAASIWARLADVASLDVHLKDALGVSVEGNVPLGDGVAELALTFVAFARQPRPTSFTLEGDYSEDSGPRISRDLARLKILIRKSMLSGDLDCPDGVGCKGESGVPGPKAHLCFNGSIEGDCIMKSAIANAYRLIAACFATLIVAEPAVAAQNIEPKHGATPTRSRPQLKRLSSLISFGGSMIAGMSILFVSALLILLIGQPKLSAEENGITLHYTSGGSGADIAKAGFNLADVQYVEQLNALPPGMKGLIWLDETSGVTPRFIAKVKPFIGNPKLFGFRLCDEPDITGKYHSPAVSSAALKAEVDWIKANVPGAVTFVTLMDMGSFEAPHFMNTFNPANTGIDFFGLNPYPVRGKVFDLDFIDRTVEAAVAAGIPLNKIVPVFQAFGGGAWSTHTGGFRDVYKLPTPDQANQMFVRWATYAPDPVFDFAYAWGSQNGDTKLGSTNPEALSLRAAFKAHNTAQRSQ